MKDEALEGVVLIKGEQESDIGLDDSVNDYDEEGDDNEDDLELNEDSKHPENLKEASKELEDDDYSFGSPRKKPEDDAASDSSEIKVKGNGNTKGDDLRFYSDEEDNEERSKKHIDEEEDPDDEKGVNKGEGDADSDYEHSPVTKPNEIKGLLKIKQKLSKLDMRLYKA